MNREEAINVVRCNWPEGRHQLSEALKTLIPELQESEDERIRKWLIALIRSNEYGSISDAGDMPCPKPRVLAWLEKQKEPEWCHHKVDLSGCSEEYRKAYYDGWNNCNQQHSQLQAEQKPAEWSEEEHDYYDAIIAKLEVTQNDAMLTGEQMSFLKSIPERFNLQPKQEWSEKDRTMRMKVLKYLSTRCSVCEYEEVEEWLNSIRPQPHWKPGEEQMEALKLAYEDALECPEGCVPHLPLKALYHDLKNL